MNEERNSPFSILDVIFNLLFITLFVFILLWLFPSKSFLAENTRLLNNGVNALAEQIFNQNITTMKETAVSYFTTPRLPKKVGDSETLTLKDMRDKNLILPLIDKNGNQCYENTSGVTITKMDDEYVLKIFLECSDKEDYILVHLGCYDYCDGDVCEKEKEEVVTYRYQYALTTACSWTGWSNWSDWSTTYVTSNTSRKVESKVIVDKINASFTTKYNCPTGYTLNNADHKCYKTTDSTESIAATEQVNYTCPNSDYQLNGKTCYLTILSNETISATANTTYSCPDGYTLNGTKCSKTETINATTNTTYSCPTGYTLNGKNCSKVVTTNATANTSYTCPDGYTLNGTKCTKTSTSAPESYVVSKRCPEGYTDNGTKCYKNVSKTDTIEMEKSTHQVCSTTNTLDCSSGTCKTVPTRTCKTVTYNRCPGAYVAGTGRTCVSTYTVTEYADYIVTYGTKCTNGGTGSDCAVTSTINATAKTNYSCPTGYTLNGTTCSKTETINATANTNYTCPEKHTLNENTCSTIKEIEATSKVQYSCMEGYTKLNDKQCTREVEKNISEEAKENKTYSCKEGYVLNEKNMCVKNTTITDKVDSTIETIYSCPATYTQEGNICTKKVTYYRSSTRSCVGGSVDYKWSLSNNDQDLISKGYKLTGLKEIATSK